MSPVSLSCHRLWTHNWALEPQQWAVFFTALSGCGGFLFWKRWVWALFGGGDFWEEEWNGCCCCKWNDEINLPYQTTTDLTVIIFSSAPETLAHPPPHFHNPKPPTFACVWGSWFLTLGILFALQARNEEEKEDTLATFSGTWWFTFWGLYHCRFIQCTANSPTRCGSVLKCSAKVLPIGSWYTIAPHTVKNRWFLYGSKLTTDFLLFSISQVRFWTFGIFVFVCVFSSFNKINFCWQIKSVCFIWDCLAKE